MNKEVHQLITRLLMVSLSLLYPVVSLAEAVDNDKPETIAKESHGKYLSPEAAMQLYMEGDNDYLDLVWNIASGYRLYLDPTYATDADGKLNCSWEGILTREFVPKYGQIQTARTWARLHCKRPQKGKAVDTLLVSYVGGSIDGHLYKPIQAWIEKPKVKFYIGLLLSDLDPMFVMLNPDFKYGAVMLYTVRAGSPAERVGLKKGDIVTEVNGMPVRSARQFVAQIQTAPAQRMEVELRVHSLANDFKSRKVMLTREFYNDQKYDIPQAKP